ncbi:MAG: hypothetical protein KGJ23_10120 [Euryarchaeota archaeon]|nr:hypothetical protein [Euryarchaeota archaeon]MDE1836960.1 hypothetical protein [Euryarchaeota archaeon]MDE1881934.1 hypothetical protein [Euryarchaeota archaeon]MDE2045855.1 hypothetical protein [Thermoplasmata archaeon]
MRVSHRRVPPFEFGILGALVLVWGPVTLVSGLETHQIVDLTFGFFLGVAGAGCVATAHFASH